MTHAHPEFEVVITQMRSLEALFLSEKPDQPIVAKDLLTICEAIRTLAEKMASFACPPEPDAARFAEQIAIPIASEGLGARDQATGNLAIGKGL